MAAPKKARPPKSRLSTVKALPRMRPVLRPPVSTAHASALLATVVLTLGLQASAMRVARAAETAPRSLTWAQLLPPAPAVQPKNLKSFLAGRPKQATTDHAAVPEGRWLSPGAQSAANPGSGPPGIVQALDGERIKIGGYVVPLDFDATTVKEFLLVPFVGACIHVPPPPPNQIVYVKSDKGIEVTGSFAPVWVTGKLRTEAAFTGLAEAGYSLNAESVESRTQ